MTNKEIAKYEQDLTECSESLNDLRKVGDSDKKYPDLKNLHQQIRNLAAEIPAPLSNVDILNAELRAAMTTAGGMEGICGELINNIHNTLQTKMMLNACVSAEKSSATAGWACWWAFVAAIVACISVILQNWPWFLSILFLLRGKLKL